MAGTGADEDMAKLLEEAGESYKECLQPGLGLEKTIELYNQTSTKYDTFVGVFDYKGPQKVTTTMEELYPDEKLRADIRVLDVAAGTGLVGVELKKAGFANLDALDPSPGMLEVAQSKNVYRNFFTQALGDEKSDIDENSYDAIVICGGMAENCIPCSAFHEMIRIVKPGGYIVNVAGEEHVKESDMYKDLDDVMDKLELQKKWKEVKNEVFDDVLRDGRSGILFVHQVL